MPWTTSSRRGRHDDHHPLAEEYLRRLESAAHTLPAQDRQELLAEIRNHLNSGLPANATEADVCNLLDELGVPEDIAAAAGPAHPTARRGPREVFALVLLVSGFPPILGWLAGAGLMLWSPLWSTRQKLLGIVVWQADTRSYSASSPSLRRRRRHHACHRPSLSKLRAALPKPQATASAQADPPCGGSSRSSSSLPGHSSSAPTCTEPPAASPNQSEGCIGRRRCSIPADRRCVTPLARRPVSDQTV